MKNKIKSALLGAFAVLFLGACAGSQPQIYDYSAFLQTKPRSIVVVMPTSDSSEIKASAAVLANALYPLSEAGYYVFSPALVNETFKNNGIYDAAEIAQISAHKLKQIFGADAALYLNVADYGTSYMLINSVTRVSVAATLVDLNTGAAAANDSGGGGGNLIGMLVSAVVKQIADSVSDASFDLSARADAILFSTDCKDCLLYGPYSPRYGRDRQLGGGK
nr:GNA1162 family protein [uncultured Campylobacter sp.]